MNAGQAVVGAAMLVVALPLPAPAATSYSAADFSKTVDTLERLCLSNSSVTQRGAVSTAFSTVMNAVTGWFTGTATLSYQRETAVLRGARADLAGAIAAIQDDKIRDCMTSHLPPQYASAAARKTDLALQWPNPMRFKFYYKRVASASPRYSDLLSIHLRSQGWVDEPERMTNQFDGTGQPIFSHTLAYPAAGDVVQGVITPIVKGGSALSSQSVVTAVCFGRPPAPPPVKADNDLFNCTEGSLCKPHAFATGWLRACPPGHAEASQPPLLRRVSLDQGAPGTEGRERTRWVVPSLDTLGATRSAQTAYSILSIKTDAFRKPGVIGVEVGLRVNGTAVEEDGLSPDLRPVANDPALPFAYSFALEQLDFDGRYGGCEAVQLRLTPLLAGGGTGMPRDVVLPFIALRPSAPRSERLGDDQLTWSALYRLGDVDQQNLAILNSFSYRISEGAPAEARARRTAEDAKAWLDGQGLTFQGSKVVGVIRPPLRAPGGLASYSLVAGLAQANGQVRFYFPIGTANALDTQIKALRTSSAKGRATLAAQRFIYRIRGSTLGSDRLPDLCRALPASGSGAIAAGETFRGRPTTAS